MRKNSEQVLRLTQLALLMAIELILSFTPLGYLTTPWGIPLSFVVLPVAIGSVIMGPVEGAFLGLVFGLTSFWKALTSPSAVSGIAMQVNPVGLFFILVGNRVLVGLIPGLIYKLFSRSEDKKIRTVGVAVSCVMTPLINTFLYIIGNSLILTDVYLEFYQGMGHVVETSGGLIKLLLVILAPNYISEALTCLVLGTAICKALQAALPRLRK